MTLFLIGLICGIVAGIFFANAKPQNTSNNAPEKVIPQAQDMPPVNQDGDKTVVKVDIPIEVLPNLYSLSVEHPTVKYTRTPFMDGRISEHISIDCELHYKLNEMKEGKRYFIFSYYDQNGNVVSHGETMPYRLTNSGMEIVHVEHYVPWSNLPKKIGVSVREDPNEKLR